MKNTTLKALINENPQIPAALIRAVVKQLGGFERFTEQAPDISNHGIDGGFHGFIYYVDTVAFTRKHKTSILKMAEDQAQDIGDPDPYIMIAGFNCFRNDPDITPGLIARVIHGRFDGENCDHTTIFNALAWYAAEEVARAYTDLVEYNNL